VPEIGDEVAVARALRRLADQLIETAEQDLEAVTGQPPTCGPAERTARLRLYAEPPWA